MRKYLLNMLPCLRSPQAEDPALTPIFSRGAGDVSPTFHPPRPASVVPNLVDDGLECYTEPDHFPCGGRPDNKDLSTLLADPTLTVGDWRPPRNPDQYVWELPKGRLTWTPKSQCNAVGLLPPIDWHNDVPICLSPHIIPNPDRVYQPLIDWDITKHRSTAKRVSNHILVDMAGIWNQTVTDTGAHRVVITCDIGYMSTLWGPITVDQNRPVTLRDLFEAIYAYFQLQLTRTEVDYILGLNPDNHQRMTDSYRKRCRESAAPPEWEVRQGFRRADVLGDCKYWMGVSVRRSSSCDGKWWLHLGLVDPHHQCTL